MPLEDYYETKGDLDLLICEKLRKNTGLTVSNPSFLLAVRNGCICRQMLKEIFFVYSLDNNAKFSVPLRSFEVALATIRFKTVLFAKSVLNGRVHSIFVEIGSK